MLLQCISKLMRSTRMRFSKTPDKSGDYVIYDDYQIGEMRFGIRLGFPLNFEP